jgi:hypothetical protein
MVEAPPTTQKTTTHTTVRRAKRFPSLGNMRRHMPAAPLGRTQGLAQSMLHDFAASGVDEDLEQLRSMWTKPPPAEADSNSDEGEDGRWPNSQSGQQRKPWCSNIEPRDDKATPAAARVKGGALDYHSAERLSTLERLRKLTTTGDEGSPFGAQTLLLAPVVGLNAARRHSFDQNESVTDIEREARKRRGDGPGLDWARWESRWAEQLRGLASAQQQQQQQRQQQHDDDDDHHHHHRATGHSQPPRGSTPPPSFRDSYRRPSAPSGASQRSGWQQRQRREREEEEWQDFEQQQQRQWQREQQQQKKKHTEKQQQKQQGQKKHPPPPRRPPSPPRPAPQAAALRRGHFASWTAFDQAFTAFEAKLPSLVEVRLADIPFPPSRDPAGLVEAGVLDGGASGASGEGCTRRKKLLRKALLRWHPDKWSALAAKVCTEEHAELGRRLSELTQTLVEQKNKDALER